MQEEQLNVLIVDDEPIARDIMENYIARIPGLTLAGKCKNALEAFGVLSNNPVDLMLLDVNMPEITGTSFLKTLKDPPLVIFTTAYPEYAIESYEYNTVDYLLKPIAFERFLKGINKAAEIIKNKRVSTNLPATSLPANNSNLLFVKSEGKLVKIDVAQLWFIEGLKDYIRLWTDNGKIIVHSTMKGFEETLQVYPDFIRVHKSYIVNLRHIDEVDGNTIRIKKQDVVIGNTYKDEVYKVLNMHKLT